MVNVTNGRCHAEIAQEEGPPLIQHGKIVLQAHHIGWIICTAFTLVAMVVSFWLIDRHLRWYTDKHKQRYIVRILFMVPLYAVVSTASYFWWNHSTPLLLIRDGYESTVLTSFFYLLLLYISPTEAEQKEIFRKNGLSVMNDRDRRRRGEPVQKWVYPLGFVRWKPADGLYFLQLMKWGVLQYCVVRPGTTLAAVILDYVGLYCEDSWSLGWGHIWITVVVSISVTIAMYCLIQLYMVVKVELAPQKPLLKLFAIKAVVFLTFWQATFLSLLTVFGIVKDTKFMTANNINIGIGAIAETVEMAIFAILHIKAFSYKPYISTDGPTPKWRALVHAMNFRETFVEIWAGWVYMYRQYRGVEVDAHAHRQAVLENVFGRSRFDICRDADGSSPAVNAPKKDIGVTIQVEKEVRVGEERQWLGAGDDYIYGLGYQSRRMRERSEGLESQIEKELERRGYSLRGNRGGTYAPIVDAEAATAPTLAHQPAQSSWWRRVYNRLSQSGPDPELENTASPPGSYTPVRHRSRSRHRSRDMTTKTHTPSIMPRVQEDYYNDPPPPSAIRTYRQSRASRPEGRIPDTTQNMVPTSQPPLLFASFGEMPSVTGPITSGPSARLSPPIPHRTLHPEVTTPPLLSPSAQSLQEDSFFDRAFGGSVAPSSSAELGLSAPPSSQSHQTQVKLGPTPSVGTRSKTVAKTPVLVGPPRAGQAMTVIPSSSLQYPEPSGISRPPLPGPSSPPRPPSPISPAMSLGQSYVGSSKRRSSHRRDSAQFFPEPLRTVSLPQPALRSSPTAVSPTSRTGHLQRAPASYSRGMRRNSGQPADSAARGPPPPANRFVPTRDKIVLPGRLAPDLASPPRTSIVAPNSPPHTSLR